jgi:hypothetical protein
MRRWVYHLTMGNATWNYEEPQARLQLTRQIKFQECYLIILGELNTDGAMTFKMHHKKRGWGDLNSVGKIWRTQTNFSYRKVTSFLSEWLPIGNRRLNELWSLASASVRSYCLRHAILLWASYLLQPTLAYYLNSHTYWTPNSTFRIHN